jgi:hypothetical protein
VGTPSPSGARSAARSTPPPASPIEISPMRPSRATCSSAVSQWPSRAGSPASRITRGAASAVPSRLHAPAPISLARPPWRAASIESASRCAVTASAVLAIEIATAAPCVAESAAARAAPASRSTRRSGCNAESTTAAMKAAAAPGVSKPKSHEPQAGGIGCRRMVASASTPSVPRDPTRSFGTS